MSTQAGTGGIGSGRARVRTTRLRPKGQVGNLFATAEPLPPLPPEVSAGFTAVWERTLLDRFARLPPLGKYFVDPRLVNYLVPFAQRSASKSLCTLVGVSWTGGGLG